MTFLQYQLTTQLPSNFDNNQLIVNTINPHSYCIAKKDFEFQNALKNSNLLVPDGSGIVFASKFVYNKKIKKIAGYDVFIHFLKLLKNKKQGKVFFLGSSENTLLLIKNKMALEYPELEVYSYSPPFKVVFDESDNLKMIAAINEISPNFLFVGMTAPKQEKWVELHKNKIQANVICSIGAVFDFYAGTVKRPSTFWINLGLEWLPRFLKDPRRLAKRNLVSTPQFLFDMIKFKFFL